MWGTKSVGRRECATAHFYEDKHFSPPPRAPRRPTSCHSRVRCGRSAGALVPWASARRRVTRGGRGLLRGHGFAYGPTAGALRMRALACGPAAARLRAGGARVRAFGSRSASAYGRALGHRAAPVCLRRRARPACSGVCLRLRAQPARSVVPGLSRLTRFTRYGPWHLRPAAPRPPLPRLWLGPRRRPARGVAGRKPVGPATTDEARSRSRTREADSGDTLCGVRASRADTRPDPGAGVP